jgi:hypothetical protein
MNCMRLLWWSVLKSVSTLASKYGIVSVVWCYWFFPFSVTRPLCLSPSAYKYESLDLTVQYAVFQHEIGTCAVYISAPWFLYYGKNLNLVCYSSWNTYHLNRLSRMCSVSYFLRIVTWQVDLSVWCLFRR